MRNNLQKRMIRLAQSVVREQTSCGALTSHSSGRALFLERRMFSHVSSISLPAIAASIAHLLLFIVYVHVLQQSVRWSLKRRRSAPHTSAVAGGAVAGLFMLAGYSWTYHNKVKTDGERTSVCAGDEYPASNRSYLHISPFSFSSHSRSPDAASSTTRSGFSTLADLLQATVGTILFPSHHTQCEIAMPALRIPPKDDAKVFFSALDVELPLASAEQRTFSADDHATIKAYNVCSYAANHPIEDRFTVVSTPEGDTIVLVLDGHGGWQVAEFAQQRLPQNAVEQIEALQGRERDDIERIKLGVRNAFLKTDGEYMEKVRSAFKLGFGDVSKVGACALLAYCTEGYVAVGNAGDVRAVIGRRSTKSHEDISPLLPIPLSNDHNARVLGEQLRLARLHPGEGDIVRCKSAEACYVKGRLQPTRSLGDVYLKTEDFNGPAYVNGDRTRGRHVPEPYSPPYIVADPEIVEHRLREEDEFMVIGTDGLWDFMANHEVVEVVRNQVELGCPEKAAVKLVECVLNRSAKKYGISLDELMNTPPGKLRRMRHDDITIVVVYFDHDSRTSDGGSAARRKSKDKSGK